MKESSLPDLAKRLAEFARERDWDQFHSPKNLAVALSVEASELLEEFQWLTEEQSVLLEPARLARVRDEIGDVLIYLTRLADRLKIDLLAAAYEKLLKNQAKYPADLVRGQAKKYTEYKP